MHNKDLKILQWNCRSIDRNFIHLKQHLAQNSYLALCLQSLNTKKSNLPVIDGYYYPPISDFEGDPRKVYTAIYIQTRLNFSVQVPPIPPNTTDIYACSAKILFQNSNFTIISTYLPKGPNDKNTDWLCHIPNNDSKYIIAGDFNAHAPFWEPTCSNISNNKFLENIVDSPFYLLNTGQITRIPDNINHKATAIDLTLISPDLAPLCHWDTWSDPFNSDHLPIILTINSDNVHTEDFSESKIPKFNYKLANWELFNNYLFQHYGSTDIANQNINDMYSSFNCLLVNAAKHAIPQLKTKHTQKHHGNVWWNTECENARTSKVIAYKKYLKNRTPENLLASKQAKNYANRVIENAKQDYWNNYCTNNVDILSDSQEIWDKIKTMKNGIQQPNYPIIIADNDLPSNADKAEAFANSFANNSRLSGLNPNNRNFRNNEEKESINNIHNNININNTFTKYFDSDITIDEVKEQIRSLNNKKSSVGLDGVSNIMLQHLPYNMIYFLLLIMNKCWSEGSLPSIWKKIDCSSNS